MANARPQTPGQLHRTGVGAPGAGLGGEGELYTDLVSGLDYQKVGGSWGQIIQPTLPTTKLTGQVTDAQISAVAGSKITGSISSATIPAASVSGAPAWTYGTAFPGSPSNGDFHTLVDSTTAPTYRWLCRYNASIGDAYKWEVLGAPFKHMGDTSGSGRQNSVDSTWQQIPGTLPTFAVPRAGYYAFEFGGWFETTNPGNAIQMAFATTGGSIFSPYLLTQSASVGTQWNPSSMEGDLETQGTALSAGQGLAGYMWSSQSTAVALVFPWFKVIPKRII